MSQQSFSDMEYSLCKRMTKRKEFLDIMDEIIRGDECVDLIKPHYFSGKRGRPQSAIDSRINRRPGMLPKVSDNAIDWGRYMLQGRASLPQR